MNNPFDYLPSVECDEAFRQLLDRVDAIRMSDLPEDIIFCRELDAGKMLGVLIAEDDAGVRHTLYAFSGQIGEGGFYFPGFVEPIFDYLEPDGYFKTHEKEISEISRLIERLETESLGPLRDRYSVVAESLESEMTYLRTRYRHSKLERKERRESGECDETELAAMIRQSQFEKAELHRLKKRHQAILGPLVREIDDIRSNIRLLKERRRNESEALQKWLFDNFRVLNAEGVYISLSEIFAETQMRIPPSGAGECCAPKLLQAAYLRRWRPVSIAEYWYGRAKGGSVRRHGEHYPACRGKCLPILAKMLEGIDVEPPLNSEYKSGHDALPQIIYENEWFCVVSKPSGMLSVPGRGVALSVQAWLEDYYGAERDVRVAHRLDQDTSGLLIATFGITAYKVMQGLFSTRRIIKRYVALLEGNYISSGIAARGEVRLPLSADWMDRPRQRVDMEGGKEAHTEYEFVGVEGPYSRIRLFPHTGRTHQLRVHAASERGLDMPIAGDHLYGRRGGDGVGRLMLHAESLTFDWPIDHRHYAFEIPSPF
ncbi:MAG: RNA pseudouridine synthase [Muribaculaceae bacterium]|nr:RNA pseudouridine synthase [Muribaculaceae bacterium]